MIPKSIKLRDCIVQLNTGLNPRDNFSLGEGSIKYITAKNLNKAGYIDFSSCDYIDEQAKEIIHRRSDIQLGDILFASRAPIGHCHLITEDPSFYDVGESIFCIRVNKEIIVPEYLCLYLSSDLFIKMASKRVTGSVIQEIRISDLLDTDVVLPDKHVQTKIAKCIGYIDKKIELNKTICFNLESMAKLLYDYWFVQFDFPDENGKPYKSSGGKMVWNEELKREIPDGWEVSTLKGKYDIKRGISYTSKDIESGDGTPMINLACVDIKRNYRDGEIKYYNGNVTPENLLSPNDLLIACTDLTRNADIVGSPILTPNDGNTYTFSMDIAKLIPNEAELNPIFLFMALRTEYYHKYIKRWASGTNVLHLDLTGLDWYKMWFPPKALQDRFADAIISFEERKHKTMVENQQLASLRDFLLPMLMNGQVKVKKGETQ